MGPRSDNRGYGRAIVGKRVDPKDKLQWVHGLITVVMEPVGSSAAMLGI